MKTIDPSVIHTIARQRMLIDEFDTQIVALLRKRATAVRAIHEAKQAAGLGFLDTTREIEIRNRACAEARTWTELNPPDLPDYMADRVDLAMEAVLDACVPPGVIL